MDKIFVYLQSNPEYITALIITAVVLIGTCVFGYFANKYNLLRFSDKWFKKKVDTPKTDGEKDALSKAEIDTTKADGFVENGDTEENEIEQKTDEKKSGISKILEGSLSFDYEDQADEPVSVAPQKPNTKIEQIITPPETQVNEKIEGKWRIMPHGPTYASELYNDNDELLIKSQNYLDIQGARQAIETLKKNIETGSFTIVMKQGSFFFKLLSPSGRLICNGEPVSTRQACIDRIEEVKRIALNAEITRG